MYGSITVPGGFGLPGSGTVDKETQDKLAHALDGLTINMNISGKAETAGKADSADTAKSAQIAQKLAEAITLALSGAISGSASMDGSGDITIQTTNNQLPIVGSITLTAAGWVSDGTMYRQPAILTELTAKHQVDLYADYAVEMDLPAAIRPVNNNGSFYAITAEPPTEDITVQYTLILTQ